MKAIALSLVLVFSAPALLLAGSPWKVSISLQQPAYVAGEPMALLVGVRNISSDTLTVFSPNTHYSSATTFLETHGPFAFAENRAIWKSVPEKVLAPGDSVRFYAQIEAQGQCVDSLGIMLPDHGFSQTFRKPGWYSVSLHLYLAGQSPSFYASNTVSFSLREPNRAEKHLIDALWSAHLVGERDFFWNCEPEARGVDLRPEDEECLRVTAARYHKSELATHLEFPLAASSQSSWRGRAVMMRMFIDDHPTYSPAIAAQRYALMTVAAAELEGAWSDLDDASKVVDDVIRHDSGLRNDPEFMMAYNRVHERDGDIELRLTSSSRRCVVGEPMLFRISIVNVSRYTLRVAGSESWRPGESFNGNNFKGYVEVEDRSGKRKRWTEPLGAIADGIRITGYAGIPLAPGDSVTLNWPVDKVVRVDDTDPRQAYGPLFRTPGEYRVRVGYRVDNDLWKLSGRGRELISQPVVIAVRAPDTTDEKILGVLPQGWSVETEQIQNMQKVLNEYPRHELAIHLHMAIAKGVAWGRNSDRQHAFNEYESAINNANGLWRDELARRQADLYRWPLGPVDGDNYGRCRGRMVALMKDQPGLWTDHDFSMTAILLVLNEYGEAAAFAESYWGSKMHTLGTKPPSWSELRDAAEHAPPRREFVGPPPPKHKPVSYRRHIQR